MPRADAQTHESNPSAWAPWLRKRLPLLVIVVGLLVISPRLFKREVELHFLVPAGAERLRVEVLQNDAVFRGIEVRLAGQETSHRETLSLSPGTYQIEATLSLAGESLIAEKTVDLPEESPVEIRF